jgi:hypothetical protein
MPKKAKIVKPTPPRTPAPKPASVKISDWKVIIKKIVKKKYPGAGWPE